jgi:hypothetical protein
MRNDSAEIKRSKAMEQAMGRHSRYFIGSGKLKSDLQLARLDRFKSAAEIISKNSGNRIADLHVRRLLRDPPPGN